MAGFASLFGGPVLALPFLLDLLQLPSDLFHLYLTADVLSSRFGTSLAAVRLTVIALIGSCVMQGVARIRVIPLLRFGGVSVVLVVSALLGLQAFYTHLVVAPYTKADALAGLQLIRAPHDAIVHKEPAPANTIPDQPRTFDQVQESGTLRVCYGPKSYPMSYFNTFGDLVGFDIEMAHLLARQLDLKLELLPLERAEGILEIINSGYCDIAMLQVPLIPSLALRFDLTIPITRATASLLVHDFDRERFATWDELRSYPEIRVGMYAFGYAKRLVYRALPEAELVPLQTPEELEALLKTGLPGVDVILNTAAEASAWTILYPHYSVVIPRPVKSFPVSYILPRGSPILLKVVNTWLSLAQGDGTIDRLYDYWVQGEIDWREPPRWSVIRDVLHWVD